MCSRIHRRTCPLISLRPTRQYPLAKGSFISVCDRLSSSISVYQNPTVNTSNFTLVI